MGAARYAFRVRGRASDEVVAALQEELEVEVEVEVDADRTSTAIKGWLPDQAALYGMLARIRLLGLELLEVRRLPRSG
jgi:phosphoribosylformimino-5-aminoimidazole carboxamide ribonucleotide (ProFAR) isomerase